MGAFIDLTGQQFGNWKVLEYEGKGKWICECQCENHTRKSIASADLRKGKTTNCGCMRKKDLTNKQFRHLIVDSYAENYHWNCHCIECGKQFIVHTYHLEHDNIPKCNHNNLHTNVDDITGKTFGQWKVISYAGNSYWNCECQCELKTKRQVLGKDLRSGHSKSCGLHNNSNVKALIESNNEFIDLKDKQFGEWKVLEYVGNRKWKCECSCGNIEEVHSYALRNGDSKSCGHNSGKLKNMLGKTFGELIVQEYIGNGIWRCLCSCNNIHNVHGHDLRSGHTKSCGAPIHKYIDITGKVYGDLKAIEYLGKGTWKCQCKCGNTVKLGRYSLENGLTKSCGCRKEINRIESLIKTGYIPNRTSEQINAVRSKDNLINFIGNSKPTLHELAESLNLNYFYTISICNKFGVGNLLKKNSGSSHLEDQLYNYISSIYKETIERHNRTILNGQELDIYIPEKKLTIEFNGTYWHSDANLDIKYHQHKTIECIKRGIRLIHIFEYEWLDEDKQTKLKNYLKHIICDDKSVKLYARDLDVKLVDSSTRENFENLYHLQSSANAKIAIGLYNKDELVGLMTFGSPRFNNKFEYELIRLCYKTSINVVGGTEKLFKHFIKNYNPTSILSYCDLSKFDGNTYFKLGFKATKDNLTSPNYVWVSPDRNDILTRYQTQKQTLIKSGLGEFGDTEDEIMKNLNYLKIYDSGNMRFEWYTNK